MNCISLRPGDIVLLCSDGLTSKVTEEEISNILRKEQCRLQHGTDQLIKKALEKREPDNITAVLFRVPYPGESLLFGRGFLWLVGLFLIITLLFIFAISRSTPFLNSIQAPKSTETPAIAETTNVGALSSSQSPTQFPNPTSSSTMTPSAANILKQSSTVASVSTISPTPPVQNSTTDQSATVTPITPDPTSTVTATPIPSPTLPPSQLEPQKIEIDFDEENGQYEVKKFNAPPLSKAFCVEVVVSTHEFIEGEKPPEGLGLCGKEEKSFAKDSLKPSNNYYVSLWLYDLSKKKFLYLLSNQVNINIDLGDSSSDESTCITVDQETGECLDDE